MFFTFRLNSSFCLLLFLASSCVVGETKTGSEVFQRCAGCHLATGAGVPGMFPPLTEHLGSLSAEQQGREYLVMVVEAGLIGLITVDGIAFQGIMPPQGSGLKDEEIAEVLNYLLAEFNSKTVPPNWQRFSEQEVRAIKNRNKRMTGHQVHAMRELVFSE